MIPAPTLDAAAAGALVDASASVLGLVIDPIWRPAVIANLIATAAAAGLVLEFPLPDELEPAPVFGA